MDLVAAAAPWWYIALLAGTFTVIGAIIAFLSTLFSDRRKAKREDRVRWDTSIRELCVESINLIRDAVDELAEPAATGSLFAKSQQELERIGLALSDKAIEIDLVSNSPALVELVRNTGDEVIQLSIYGSGKRDYEQARDDLDSRRADVVAHTRVALRIPKDIKRLSKLDLNA